MNYLYFLYIEFLAKHNIPQLFGDITFYVIPFCVVAVALILVVLFLVLAERKLLGFFTQRKGPNRVGFWGVLQTIADAFKLLCKENITPEQSDKFLFNLAPILVFVPMFAALGILPYSAEFTFVNTQPVRLSSQNPSVFYHQLQIQTTVPKKQICFLSF